MAKHDVFAAPGGDLWLLDVQTDLLDSLNLRIVVPLMPLPIAPAPARRLNPTFEIDGVKVSMVTQYLASVQEKTLGQPIANLSQHHNKIAAALDMVFQGF